MYGNHYTTEAGVVNNKLVYYQLTISDVWVPDVNSFFRVMSPVDGLM